VHGFPGYAVGEPLPTTVQVLNGEKPANSAPVRVEMVPGTKFQYSGGVRRLLLRSTGVPAGLPKLGAGSADCFTKISVNYADVSTPELPSRLIGSS
jgi:hypothetical protein